MLLVVVVKRARVSESDSQFTEIDPSWMFSSDGGGFFFWEGGRSVDWSSIYLSIYMTMR